MIINLKNWKPYVWSILITLGLGTAVGLLTQGAMRSYEAAVKPSLTPPSAVFPVVWAILYLLMAVGAAMVWLSDSPYRKSALTAFAAQLLVNLSWSFFFFNLHAYLFSFIWLVLLFILILIMIFYFSKVNKFTAYLQIPYLLWVMFAGYLNWMIYILNR